MVIHLKRFLSGQMNFIIMDSSQLHVNVKILDWGIKNMKKKVMTLILAGIMAVGVFTGCGGSGQSETSKNINDRNDAAAESGTEKTEASDEQITLKFATGASWRNRS